MHQPHYLPWLGFLDKLDRADLFIYIDHVQYERGGWQNRNFVKSANGAVRLTVPVRRGALQESLLDKVLDDGRPWRRKHAATLRQAYRRAPFVEAYPHIIDVAVEATDGRLVELNLRCCSLLADAFGVTTPTLRSSELGPVQGAKSDMLVELCRRVGATAYLSGDGAAGYLDEQAFVAVGLDVVRQGFTHPTYRQQHMQHGFIAQLSAVDLLFNEGEAALEAMRAPRNA